MFIDQVKMKCIAGKGGNGAISWRREKYIPKGGPYGGNGGPGGSIYLTSDDQVYSLDHYRNSRKMLAEHGKAGGTNNKQGKSGQDLIIKVPCGTLVKDGKTQEVLHDFIHSGEKFRLCIGGKGGKGNSFFKTSTNQAPNKCTPGKPGDTLSIELELKLIADVGLIGMPNAGKSTLLSKMANIPIKTGSYPFTTLKPNLSYLQFQDYSRIYIADIPGIIENAHQNKGLGLSFLRHIERTSTLVYLVDTSGIDGRDPLSDFLTLYKELQAYDKNLTEKSFLVILNKIDTEDSIKHLTEFYKNYPFDPQGLFELSALTGTGIPVFITKLKALAQYSGKRY